MNKRSLRCLSFLLTIFLLIAAVPVSVSAGLLGDVDETGVISTTDARNTLDHIVGNIQLSEEALQAADVDENGQVDVFDAYQILAMAVQKIVSYTPRQNTTQPDTQVNIYWMPEAEDEENLNVVIYMSELPQWPPFSALLFRLRYDGDGLIYSDVVPGSSEAMTRVNHDADEKCLTIGAVQTSAVTEDVEVVRLHFKITDLLALNFSFSIEVEECLNTLGYDIPTNVIKPLHLVYFEQFVYIMKKGSTQALSLAYFPADTTDDTTATFTSEHPDIVSVQDGVVTAHQAGISMVCGQIGELIAFCGVVVLPDKLGDIDRDDAITVTDARLALQAAVEKVDLDLDQYIVADVDGQGTVTVTDARRILQAAVGKSTLPPIPEEYYDWTWWLDETLHPL